MQSEGVFYVSFFYGPEICIVKSKSLQWLVLEDKRSESSKFANHFLPSTISYMVAKISRLRPTSLSFLHKM